MLMLYVLNDRSTIRDAYFLCKSWMQGTNGELHLQTRIAVFSLKVMLAYSVDVHAAYRTTAVLLETFFIWFTVTLEIRLES